ncbi:MAG: PEP-CTERM sorting domain-containing protein [Akkermansiaceae bacterium]|nr:PEP-CTERM sorting domain-containing protein [Akkermansiaceae bacterium]MCP5544377.1 PEP-CTERM sorting domain-containing protein [Akkermansiaceae bacterium]MCP5547447.1 PEP-CTERM sorting domain-containing protein [Akkermansiaceae bacterium]
MKHLLTSLLFALPCAHAATTFLGTVDTNFNNAANWDSGLPTNTTGAGTIAAGKTAVMTGNYLMSNDNAISVTDIHVEGSLTTGANTLQMLSGTVTRNPDLWIDGGTFTVSNGGEIYTAGAAADTFINGGGSMIIESGGSIRIQKAVEVLNGSLTFAAGAVYTGTLQDELVVGSSGTLAFGFDASFNHLVVPGSSLQMELAPTSTLDLTFATAPTSYSSFTLVTDVSGFTLVGGSGTGVFGNINVTGLGAGQSVVVDYGTTTAGELAITIVPEPSPWWLGLAGGGLFFVRRRR